MSDAAVRLDAADLPDDAAALKTMLVAERGMRLDESAPGHGIGLAVVRDIAASYGGEVNIGRSALGGAEVTVTLGKVPAASGS